MHSELVKKIALRRKRAQRVRSKMHGTRVKPRLSVFKSNKHLAVQLIDDDAGETLAAVSTYSKEYNGKTKATAERLGQAIAEKAKEHQIKEVLFDRGCYRYHGLLAVLADAVRGAGIHL